MKVKARFVTAAHPELGTIWASIDPETHYTEGRIAERRFAAFLSPFRSQAAAEAALIAAGGKIERVRA